MNNKKSTIISQQATNAAFGMELYEKFLASKTQLADLCPRERVDFCLILEDENSHVGNGEMQCDALVILYHTNQTRKAPILPYSS